MIFKEEGSSFYQDDNVPSKTKKRLFWDKLFNRQRSAMGCSRINISYKELIESFMRVSTKSDWDAIDELYNIKMREGKLLTAFWNRFRAICQMKLTQTT